MQTKQYTHLPEDLLKALLVRAGEVGENIEGMLDPALRHKEELREALCTTDLVASVERETPLPVCGVDGGFVVERTTVIDILLSAAVGVEGLGDRIGTTLWDAPRHQSWVKPLEHNHHNDWLCRGVMAAQEMSILASAPHPVRILDGSYATLVIPFHGALNTIIDGSWAILEEAWDRFDAVASLYAVCRDPAIVAMPKYDSSRGLANRLEAVVGRTIPGDDKYLLSLLLEPGEYIVPQPVPKDTWSKLSIEGPEKREGVGRPLMEAIQPLRDAKFLFTYFKPTGSPGAFRIEIKEGVEESFVNTLLSTIEQQTAEPFLHEPYPQYLADVMAKSVGQSISALRAAIQLRLSQSSHPEMASFLLHSYRTEGVSYE